MTSIRYRYCQATHHVSAEGRDAVCQDTAELLWSEQGRQFIYTSYRGLGVGVGVRGVANCIVVRSTELSASAWGGGGKLEPCGG